MNLKVLITAFITASTIISGISMPTLPVFQDKITITAEAKTKKATKLTKNAGVFNGPTGKEAWYNLNMNRVVRNMRAKGYKGRYWVRKDGVKMFGNYILCAANLRKYPRGTIVETSLGPGIVADTGALGNGVILDIAVNW